MTPNDIFRRVRYIFDLSDDQMMAIFAAADTTVTRKQISEWLKKDDQEDFVAIRDRELATFLNGFINKKRGKREGAQPTPEKRLSNNQVFMKLKIALSLQADDILAVLGLVGFRLSKHELSAFFRKPTHKHYRECKDQVLRNFLHGLQIKHRGETDSDDTPESSSDADKDADQASHNEPTENNVWQRANKGRPK